MRARESNEKMMRKPGKRARGEQSKLPGLLVLAPVCIAVGYGARCIVELAYLGGFMLQSK